MTESLSERVLNAMASGLSTDNYVLKKQADEQNYKINLCIKSFVYISIFLSIHVFISYLLKKIQITNYRIFMLSYFIILKKNKKNQAVYCLDFNIIFHLLDLFSNKIRRKSAIFDLISFYARHPEKTS